MKPRTIIIFIVLLAAVGFFIFHFHGRPGKNEYVFYPMGGMPCSIVEYGRVQDKFLEDTRLAEKRVDELEDIFSGFRPSSEVSKLKDSPAGELSPVSSPMYFLLEKSLQWYGKSDGAFDITVAPIVNLWKRAGKEKKLPAEEELKSVLLRTGSDKITVANNDSVEFSRNNMELDFGGIAKGYILDQIGNLLEARGVEKYVVSCGGDAVMRGKESFRVGVQEPGGGEGELMMVLNTPPGGVVTSGHYERFTEIDDKRYSHIIDPATGWPVDNDLVSITIIGGTATDADALATAVAVLGLERAVEFLGKSDGYKAVLLRKVGEDFELHYSKSLEGAIEYRGGWGNIPKIPF